MTTRREFLIELTAAAVTTSLPAKAWSALNQQTPIITKADKDYLRALAKETVKLATLAPGQGGNICGFPLITPGGNYPSFWIRDFSMALGNGLIDAPTVLNHLRLVAKTQNGATERKLKSGAIIPPYAIADHIRPDGQPVFYPGTYSPGEDQGGEPWGILPPIDDHYEFINIAHEYWQLTRKPDFLKEEINGLTLFDRLAKALDCPAIDPDTGLVFTTPERRAVGFGFCDTVYMTGKLLFASLLRHRALGQMVALCRALGKKERIGEYQKSRALLEQHLKEAFVQDGWLMASTGVGRQVDVWGTLYALHIQAVQGEPANVLRRTVINAVRAGTIHYKGAVRHIPTDKDFSASSAWEKTAGVALNTYQNGAYWHVPTGWLVEAVSSMHRGLPPQLVNEMIAHFKAEDWRKKEDKKGAPWECLSPVNDYRQNAAYMASVTVPLSVLSKL